MQQKLRYDYQKNFWKTELQHLLARYVQLWAKKYTTRCYPQGSWNTVAIGNQYILTGDYNFNFLDSIHFLNP